MVGYLTPEDQQHCLALVRDNAPDFYLSDLLLPEPARDPIIVLHAFHVEITNITLARPEPIAGEIRLQWWRDVLNGERDAEASAHPAARACLAVLNEQNLQAASLVAKLDAHIFDLYNDPMADRTMLEGYLGETRSILFHYAAQICANSSKGKYGDAAGHAGVASGIVGLLETLHLHRHNGQVYLPKDLLNSVGLSPEEFLSAPTTAHENAIIGMVDLARDHLTKAIIAVKALDNDTRHAFRSLALLPLYLKRLEKQPKLAFEPHKPLSQLRRQWALWRGI